MNADMMNADMVYLFGYLGLALAIAAYVLVRVLLKALGLIELVTTKCVREQRRRERVERWLDELKRECYARRFATAHAAYVAGDN